MLFQKQMFVFHIDSHISTFIKICTERDKTQSTSCFTAKQHTHIRLTHITLSDISGKKKILSFSDTETEVIYNMITSKCERNNTVKSFTVATSFSPHDRGCNEEWHEKFMESLQT